MDILLNIFRVTLEEGLMYALLAMGVYITYSILDFPDLSVDGTMPMGAVVTAVLIIAGVNPWLCLLISFVLGMLAGTVTGLLHVKLNIRPLLCGIIVYTAMLSVNLVILFKGNNGITVASFFKKPTIFNSGLAALLPAAWRITIVSLVLVVIFKLAMDFYLRTKSGLLLRAVGDNEKYVTMLAKDPGKAKILGLAIGNGFASLAGCVIAQAKGSADQQMGVGMVVLGLASVIIGMVLGEVILRKHFNFIAKLSFTSLGAIIYFVVLRIVMLIGLSTDNTKLFSAVIVAVFLAVLELTRTGTICISEDNTYIYLRPKEEKE